MSVDLRRDPPFLSDYEDNLGMLEVLKKRLKSHSSTLQSCLETMSTVLNEMSTTFSQLEHFQSLVSKNGEVKVLYKEVGGAMRRLSQHAKD